MDPKMRGDWVSRREAMTLETLVSGGFCAPALLELRLKEDRHPAYPSIHQASRPISARLMMVLQQLRWRHAPSHATQLPVPASTQHADCALTS